MFAQILLALLAVWLFYTGVVERSVFDIIVGCILITSSAGMFYAARTGSSFAEGIDKWRKQSTDTKANKL